MNNNDFVKRLIKYRTETKGIKTKKEMANLLGISDRFYAMVERGDKTPSKNLIKALVKESGLKEPYWLYGVQNDPLDDREDFKMIKSTLKSLVDNNIVDGKSALGEEIENIILNSCIVDLKYLLFKKERDEELKRESELNNV